VIFDIPMRFRTVLKKAVFAVSILITSPLILASWIERKIAHSEGLFAAQGQFLSLIPGAVGVYLRAAYYFATVERCSWEIHIGFGSIFISRAVRLGAHVSMGSYCIIGNAWIGDGVLMASRVSIPSGKHQHLDGSGEFSATPRFEKVTIGERTWIGEGAIILADVGANCVIGAGTVITKRFPNGQVIAGNPGKVIKETLGIP
jgi:acetyltransferase-like isoleucine patch superfamily enzyme